MIELLMLRKGRWLACLLVAGLLWFSGARACSPAALPAGLWNQSSNPPAQDPDTLIGWKLLEPLNPLPLLGSVPRSIQASMRYRDLPSVQHPVYREALLAAFARLLNVTPDAMDHPSLYSFIASWWQVPYRYGGDSPKGIDCSAFAETLYENVFGWTSLPRTARQLYWECRKIHLSRSLKEGDLVFFRIGSPHITHVGIYLKNHRFVHASLSEGVTISDLNDPYWKRHYVCGGQPRD